MVTTVNKLYPLQANGANIDTWGVLANADGWTTIDNNLGGVVSKTLTNTQVNLTADESENLRLILTGTLTGNVLVTTLCSGFTIVENRCTGAFTVTFQKFGVGSPVALANGSKTVVCTDVSNSPVAIENAVFPSGTRLVFQQTAAPTGWTKDLTQNDKALRVVSGTAGTGGSVAFTTAFASQAVNGTVQGHTLTIAEIPAHDHAYNQPVVNQVRPTGSGAGAYGAAGATTGQTGGGGSHDHGFVGTAINLAVAYVDTIIATKD